jgi:hypothetical protein
VLEHKNLEFLILLTTHASRPIPSVWTHWNRLYQPRWRWIQQIDL